MSNIISIHYLFQFVIFIYIIHIYIAIETKIKFAFLNGFNVIRCSNEEVQIYNIKEESNSLLSDLIQCDKKDDFFFNGYAGYRWSKLTIICSSDMTQVHEQQLIIKSFEGHDGILQLPDTQGKLGHVNDSYELRIEQNVGGDDDTEMIISKDQPANNMYFNKNTDPKERRIYLWFSDHPIICRLKYIGNNDNPCPSMNNQEIDNVDYTCYYNPGSGHLPSTDEMEAELEQIEQTSTPDNDEAYVLELPMPAIVPFDPSQPSKPNSTKPITPINKKKKITSHKPTKTKKSNVKKYIILIFGILLLIALIGGIAFYIFQKHRSNNSTSSSTSIDGGDNHVLPSHNVNQSQESLSVVSTNDENTELSTKDLSKHGKPHIELQVPTTNKKQRTATSIILDDDT